MCDNQFGEYMRTSGDHQPTPKVTALTYHVLERQLLVLSWLSALEHQRNLYSMNLCHDRVLLEHGMEYIRLSGGHSLVKRGQGEVPTLTCVDQSCQLTGIARSKWRAFITHCSSKHSSLQS